jgi:hypothetical protein
VLLGALTGAHGGALGVGAPLGLWLYPCEPRLVKRTLSCLLARLPALSLTLTTRLAFTRWWWASALRTARRVFRGILSVRCVVEPANWGVCMTPCWPLIERSPARVEATALAKALSRTSSRSHS